MEVSDHLQRELVYSINAFLLQSRNVPEAEPLAQAIIDVLERHGARFHEPTLLRDWATAVSLEPEELVFELQLVLEVILEELEDDEEPWSAHRVFDLLAEEPFWVLRWGQPGDVAPTPLQPVRGVPLPITLRPGLVAIIHGLEVHLFDAYQSQRSVHDRLPPGLEKRAVDLAMSAIELLFLKHAAPGSAEGFAALTLPSGSRPSLREALARVQRWKLSVLFDAAPDEDDGEWTMRVLERLYLLEWTVAPASRGS